jgi:hypothetical protein
MEKKINNQKSFLWKMDFAIKFYAFYNPGNNFKKLKNLKLIKKPRLNAESACAVPQQNRVFLSMPLKNRVRCAAAKPRFFINTLFKKIVRYGLIVSIVVNSINQFVNQEPDDYFDYRFYHRP